MSLAIVNVCGRRYGRAGRGVFLAQIAAISILCAILSLFVRTVHAQDHIDHEQIAFDIPPQPLETALEAFGERSRFQVLYETALTAGRRSNGVQGNLTRSAALRRLLAGTGVDFNYTDEQSFTLVPVRRSAGQVPAVGNQSRYLGHVQANVLAVLCRSSDTRPGDFHMAIQFWIGSSGRVEKPRLLGSTGTDRRDAAITAALRTLAFDRSPPSDMPQPITMVLRPGPDDANDECASAHP